MDHKTIDATEHECKQPYLMNFQKENIRAISV